MCLEVSSVCQYKSYEGSYRAAEVVAAAAVGNGVTLALVLLCSEIQTNVGGCFELMEW